MAVISYYRPLADFDQSSWLGEVSGSSTRLTITDGYHKESFTGSFRFNYWGDAVTGGTLNGYSYTQDGTLFMSISGLSLSAVTVYNLYTSQRAAELLLLMHAGNDTVKGSKYADVLAGYEGNDSIYGYAGDDQLIGGNGNDLLDGGTGSDTLTGGLGDDIYVIDSLTDVIIENANEGTDQVRVDINTVGGSYTLGANLENAALINKVAFNLVGNDLNNVLLGNAAANRIDGGLGADTMNGGAGNDTYVVDDIGDVIIDSAGIDTVETDLSYTLGNGLENLVLTGNQAISGTGNTLANVLDGSQNAAANELRGLGGNDTYIVGIGDTVIEEANGGIDSVQSAYSYTLGDNLENLTLLGSTHIDGTGNGLVNTITGNDGNNVLDGGAGVDTLRGGKGNDTYIIDLTTKNTLEDSFVENANEGSDTVQLRGGNAALTTVATIALANNFENLDASATGSTRLNLTGNALDNVITGNAANNVLNGGAGADTLIGGDGNDTYVVDNVGDVVTEQADQGIDLVQVAIATAGGTYTLGDHVENATLTSKVAFNLTGNDLANTLIGNAANNVLDGGLGADVMNGGAGNDTYIVDDSGDVIIDSAGIDTVRASIAYTLGNGLENLELTGDQAISGTGNNLANILDGSQNAAANELRGLGGNDTYIVGAGDTVIEEANGGIDLVKVYVSYVLGDNLENLSLLGSDNLNATGNALTNTLIGNDGNNTLDGGAGVDKLLGGKGDDTYIVDLTSKNTLQDSITELAGEGNDTLVLRGGNDTLKASTLKLQLHLENLDASQTGSVQLHLTGNALDNILTGNDADNILSGEAGNDQLFGGDGNDILIGGIGADILSGGAGNDIFRFTALNHLGLGEGNQDVIVDFVSGEDTLDFKAFKGYSFKGDDAFDGTKQLRYERVDDGLMLYGNSGGDLNPDFSIKLLGVSQLQAGDLLLG
ncbi:calcium-binding protein [Pseudomonas sp. C11]|uniref:beta strand repeat-containing protein n=1 Tax=Pseudomonas sp. C11 TaxID=3075550 RepID=UPI002AFE15E8|nr:calcium-binding protein [Pseudomonas sp. C11]